MGFDIKQFNQVLDILVMENIRYKYLTVNQSVRFTGINQNYSIMYYVYVHKKDAEIADHLISQRLRQ